jgi:hypothetical protein
MRKPSTVASGAASVGRAERMADRMIEADGAPRCHAQRGTRLRCDAHSPLRQATVADSLMKSEVCCRMQRTPFAPDVCCRWHQLWRAHLLVGALVAEGNNPIFDRVDSRPYRRAPDQMRARCCRRQQPPAPHNQSVRGIPLTRNVVPTIIKACTDD